MAKSPGRDPLDGRPTTIAEDGDTNDDLRAAAEAVGIWNVSPVEDEPTIRATHWKIFGVRGVETAMLLACYNPAGREGCAGSRAGRPSVAETAPRARADCDWPGRRQRHAGCRA